MNRSASILPPNRRHVSANTESIPDIPLELLQDLERRFPDKAPTIGTSSEKVWYNAGAASVVRFLRHHYDRQNQ